MCDSWLVAMVAKGSGSVAPKSDVVRIRGAWEPLKVITFEHLVSESVTTMVLYRR